ncbi:hypothetical protein, partial [Streptomyces sp. NPDC007355]|uniref:hypothetical protein n=1 Tax=Streptomyces sp. NPDC007355 TaxID=3364778 RepID=UPI0036C74518
TEAQTCGGADQSLCITGTAPTPTTSDQTGYKNPAVGANGRTYANGRDAMMYGGGAPGISSGNAGRTSAEVWLSDHPTANSVFKGLRLAGSALLAARDISKIGEFVISLAENFQNFGPATDSSMGQAVDSSSPFQMARAVDPNADTMPPPPPGESNNDFQKFVYNGHGVMAAGSTFAVPVDSAVTVLPPNRVLHRDIGMLMQGDMWKEIGLLFQYGEKSIDQYEYIDTGNGNIVSGTVRGQLEGLATHVGWLRDESGPVMAPNAAIMPRGDLMNWGDSRNVDETTMIRDIVRRQPGYYCFVMCTVNF